MAEGRFISKIEIVKKDIKITVKHTLTKIYYNISKNSKIVEENAFYDSDSDALYALNQKIRRLAGYSIEVEHLV